MFAGGCKNMQENTARDLWLLNRIAQGIADQKSAILEYVLVHVRVTVRNVDKSTGSATVYTAKCLFIFSNIFLGLFIQQSACVCYQYYFLEHKAYT